MYIRVYGKLKLELLPNGRWCELIDALQVIVDNELILIPAGFQTDFASVPRVFWNIIPPMGLHTIAAVTHDYLYHRGLCPRKTADRIFYNLMRFYGVGRLKSSVMYLAVRLFGGSSFN